MPSNWFLIIPILTALTGLLCARLPVFLLLRPVTPIRFLGIRFQGLLAASQPAIAKMAGGYISREFSLEPLELKIKDPANFEKIKPTIEIHIDDFLRNKLKEQMPMIGMFIGDKTINTMKEVFIREIGEMFPSILGQFAGNLRSEFNLGELAEAKIAAINMEQAVSAIESRISVPVRKLGLTGFLIGLAIGLLQFAIILLAA
ncbi:MAG: hypothetical protein EOO09_11495 [Chitinophagaceae bacterium]|nr:MAG: hypothetical protein EOO09_11495 [Chitinophagaceae bacterium]